MYIVDFFRSILKRLTTKTPLTVGSALAIIAISLILIYGIGIAALYFFAHLTLGVTLGVVAMITLLVIAIFQIIGAIRDKRTERIEAVPQFQQTPVEIGPEKELFPGQFDADQALAREQLSEIGTLTWSQYAERLFDHLHELPPGFTPREPSKFVKRHLGRRLVPDDPVLREWYATKKMLWYDPFPTYVPVIKVVRRKPEETLRRIHRLLWTPLIWACLTAIGTLLCPVVVIALGWSSQLIWFSVPLLLATAGCVVWLLIRRTQWSGYRVVATLKKLYIIYQPFQRGSSNPFDLHEFSVPFKSISAPTHGEENSPGSTIAARVKMSWAAGETDAQRDEIASQLGPFDDGEEVALDLEALRLHARTLDNRYSKSHESWAAAQRRNRDILAAQARVAERARRAAQQLR